MRPDPTRHGSTSRKVRSPKALTLAPALTRGPNPNPDPGPNPNQWRGPAQAGAQQGSALASSGSSQQTGLRWRRRRRRPWQARQWERRRQPPHAQGGPRTRRRLQKPGRRRKRRRGATSASTVRLRCGVAARARRPKVTHRTVVPLPMETRIRPRGARRWRPGAAAMLSRLRPRERHQVLAARVRIGLA